MLTVWGLSQAQAAVTLPTLLIGVELGLFPQSIFNGGILMILVTSITSPLIVQRFGPACRVRSSSISREGLFERILLPVANPAQQEYFIALAELLARAKNGTLLPLHVAQEIDGQVTALENEWRMLEADLFKDPQTVIQPIRRVDTSIAKGVLRETLENDVSLIMMAWEQQARFPHHIFGSVLDEVVWGARVPVLAGRVMTPVNALQRIILVIPPNTMGLALADVTLEIAVSIADALNVPLRVMATPGYMARLKAEIADLNAEHPIEITRLEGNIIKDVTDEAGPQDLILITSKGSKLRFRSSLGHIPEGIVSSSSDSVLVVHYP
jgi:hypothetical protein